MTSPELRTAISVRGEAWRLIPPDRCVLTAFVSYVADDAPDARTGLVRESDAVRSALTDLGAVLATPQTERAALTLVTGAIHSGRYWEDDDSDRRRLRQQASCSTTVSVRDLSLLPAVADVLVGRDAVSSSSAWAVDEDNPAWREVRAEAVHVALQRGRDYAAALDGRVIAVDHLADAGLLEGSGSRAQRSGWVEQSASFGGGPGGSGDEELTIDPVPQRVSAVVEARLIAELPPLPPG